VEDSRRAVDAVVVGGGIAGVSAAHFLAQEGAAVLVVEREPVLAHHTTGRSAALYMENYGSVPVRRLALASRPFLAAPPDGLADADLLSPRPALEVGGPGRAEELDRRAARGTDLVSGIQLLSPAEVVALCPVVRVEQISGGVLDPGSMDIDVMALHQAFVRGLRRAGGAVRTAAPVVALDRVGGNWRVRMPDGELTAPIVVNAAGAWGDQLAGLAGVRPVGLRPLRRTAFTVGVPAEIDPRAWPLVHDLDEGWYFKPEGDGLLCSLADEAPDEPRDPRPRDEDVALALDRINAATTLGLRSVRTAWAGLRTFAPDRMPVVGVDPEVPGFVWVAGLGGVGIMTSPAVGMLAAASALGRPLPAPLAARSVEPADYSVQRLR
jgi:D-arginine dehydrogenase